MSHLKERIVSGGRWVALTTLVTSGIGMVTTIILPKLLSPDDFGLFALGNLIAALAVKASGWGQGEFIIFYRGTDKQRARDIAFTTYLLINVVFFIAQIMMAKLLATFFNNSRLVPLYICMSWGYLITAFSLIPNAVLSKSLLFQRKFWPEFIGVLVYTLVAFGLAFWGRGVWSLVYSSLASNFVIMALVWAASGWRPRLDWDLGLIREMLGYGLPLTLNGLLVYAWFNVDRLFIGKVLNSQQLGYYAVAYQFSYLIPMKLTQIINTLAFPVYSAIDEERSERDDIFLRSFALTCFLAGAVAMLIYILADPFVLKMYGQGWKPTAEVMKIFSVFSFASIVSTPLVSLLMSTGRTNHLLWATLLGAALAVMAMPWSIKYGIHGVALCMTVSVYLYTAALLVLCYLQLKANRSNMMASLLLPLVIALMIVLLMKGLGLSKYPSTTQPLPWIFAESFIAFIIYTAANVSFKRDLARDLMIWLKRGK